jgi:hypothetical protein
MTWFFRECCTVRTIRSTIPRGRVRSIKLDFDVTGFTVVRHRDVPGRNIVDLIEQDQPFLVERDVRHMPSRFFCWRTRISRF